jgi:hypothetical protein
VPYGDAQGSVVQPLNLDDKHEGRLQVNQECDKTFMKSLKCSLQMAQAGWNAAGRTLVIDRVDNNELIHKFRQCSCDQGPGGANDHAERPNPSSSRSSDRAAASVGPVVSGTERCRWPRLTPDRAQVAASVMRKCKFDHLHCAETVTARELLLASRREAPRRTHRLGIG